MIAILSYVNIKLEKEVTMAKQSTIDSLEKTVKITLAYEWNTESNLDGSIVYLIDYMQDIIEDVPEHEKELVQIYFNDYVPESAYGGYKPATFSIYYHHVKTNEELHAEGDIVEEASVLRMRKWRNGKLIEQR